MYWIYLFLFVCMIFTPEVVSDGLFFFGEGDLESIVIFILGLIGLLLYLGKESALIRVVTEKLSLQQESNKIRKDLAQTYTYIGEMNRQLEILKNMIVESPHTAKDLLQPQDRQKVFQPVFSAALLLSQSDAVELIFVDTTSSQIVAAYASHSSGASLLAWSAEELLDKKKYWWQEDGVVVVRSQEESMSIAAFLIVRSLKNKMEDVGIFQILVTHALLLFALGQAQGQQSFEW